MRFAARDFVRQYVLLLLAIAAFAITLAAHYIHTAPSDLRASLYNADLFYLPDLITDLAHGGDFRLWHLSNTSYLFPDVAILALTLALTNNIVLGVVIGGLIQIMLIVVGFAWLSARLYGANMAAISVVCAALYFLALRHLNFHFELILFNGFHVGIVIMTPYILLLALSLQEENRRSRTQALALIGLLTMLTTTSDALFIPQTGAPLVAAICLLAIRRSISARRATAIAAFIGATAIAGLALKRIILPTDQILLRVSPQDALWTIVAQLPDLLAPWPWLGIVWAAFIILSTAYLVRWAVFPTHSNDRHALVLATIVLGLPFTIAAMAFEGVTLERYMLNLLYLPTFLGWPLLIGAWLAPSAAGQRNVAGLATSIALVAGLTTAPQLGAAATLFNYAWHYPPLVACLDRHAATYGLRRGITQYWQARLINLFSRQGLRAAQTKPDLVADHWMNSLAEYEQEFNFVVVDMPPHTSAFSLLPNLVLERFGAPAASFRCGNSEVYVYNRPDHIAFRAHTQINFIEQRIRPGLPLTIPGAFLQGKLGHPEGEHRISRPGERGYLSIGSPFRLPKGMYRLDIMYQASGEDNLGALDVVALPDSGNEIELGEGLPILTTPGRRIRVFFHLKEANNFDIQLYVNGKGSVRLDHIQLTQLDLPDKP